MFKVKKVEYHKTVLPGDALILRNRETIGVFYSYGIILNDNYFPGTLRFIKNSTGSRNMTSLKQHGIFSEEICGKYKKNKVSNNLVFNLNFKGNSWQLASLENILFVLNGKNTFNQGVKTGGFYKELVKQFPEIEFSEVGSSNVNLSETNSDRDIYVMNDHAHLMKELRDDFTDFGLRINKKLFDEEVKLLCLQYDFPKLRAEDICLNKLAGLEFEGSKVNFFNAQINPVLEYIFKPNLFDELTLEGVVTNEFYGGHFLVNYDIESDVNYSVAFVRKQFPKKKSYILKEGDKVKLKGLQINQSPNVIIAQNLRIV